MKSLHEKILNKALYSCVFEGAIDIPIKLKESQVASVMDAIAATKSFVRVLKEGKDSDLIFERNKARIAAAQSYQKSIGYSWPF